jgi:hypothetical protein
VSGSNQCTATGKWTIALLQAVYRDTKLELRVRIEAASKALPYELPKPEFATPAGDVVPLHERLRAYARARLIQASQGKVVDTGQSQEERLGLQPVHRHRQDLDENNPAFRSKTPDDAEGINAKQAPPRAPDWRYVDDDDGNWMRIPTIVTTRSDGSRPPVPIDRDQCDGAVRCIF